MKIFGSSKKSKHSGAHSPAAKRGSGRKKKKKSGLSGLHKALITIAAVIAALALAVFIFVETQIKPPDVTQTPNNPNSGTVDPGPDDPGTPDTPPDDPGTDTPDPGPDDPGADDPGTDDPDPVPQGPQRIDGIYTFLALGTDKISGSTDTIMIARFNTNDYSLNVVSIPRDILVNVPWSVKKINTLYSFMGRDEFLQGFADVLGFQPVAGAVGDSGVQIGLPVVGKLVLGHLEDVKSLKLVPYGHILDSDLPAHTLISL